MIRKGKTAFKDLREDLVGKDLRQFLRVVREAGSEFYVEVKRSLRPICEPFVIQHKLARQGRFPVIYCPEIDGSKLPLVTNLFGSYEMLGLALDIAPEHLKEIGKSGIFQEYRRRQGNFKPPREISARVSPVREVVIKGQDIDLGLLPITQHAEFDSGKFITTGMTISKDPDTGMPHVGIYRMEVKGKDKLSCMMVPSHRGALIARRYAELRKPMEVVTCVGHHPAVAMGAVTTDPLVTNRLEGIGALLGEPVELTPALTVDLPVFARAEIAIEGVIDPSRMDADGPFGETYGYYGEKQPSYIIQIKAITMRQDAIYHDLYPVHQEHSMVGILGRESNLYNKVKNIIPTAKAINFAPEGYTPKTIIYMSIKKRFPGEGRLAGLAALSADPHVKIAVVVNEDIDVYNESEVLWAIGTGVRGDRDVSLIAYMPSIILNPIGYDEAGVNKGPLDTKILIDATRPVGAPFPTRVTPPKELLKSMRLDDYLK